MCLYGNHKASALLGFCGFMFRQTNIVWTVFCAGNVVAEKLNEAWKTELMKKKDEKVSAMKGSFPDLIRVLKFLIEYLTSPKNLVTLVALTWPYIILVTAFFVFVFVNGGIVVGDRSSHEACLHFPQLFYFLSFTVFFSFPHLLTPTKISKFLLSLRKHPVQYGLITIISLFLVWKFTYVHKYLLADNRHYTFYVWRKIFQRHELVKYALVPAYIFAGWSFFDTLKTKPVFWTLMYFVCLLAVTVPQKLLEFRYFILPFLIYRLNIPFPSLSRQLLELAFYIAVNVVAFFLFLNKTFQWPNSVEVQRFMWWLFFFFLTFIPWGKASTISRLCTLEWRTVFCIMYEHFCPSGDWGRKEVAYVLGTECEVWYLVKWRYYKYWISELLELTNSVGEEIWEHFPVINVKYGGCLQSFRIIIYSLMYLKIWQLMFQRLLFKTEYLSV